MARGDPGLKEGESIMSRVRFNTDLCTGCGLCEIMCAFHHKKVFSRRLASIEVSEFLKDKNRRITLHDKDEDGHISCDGCKGLNEPLCIKYCYPKAIIEVK
jgi:Fe-S-cluster-containing hydrogenase component 2